MRQKLMDDIRRLQSLLCPGAALDPVQVQVQLYRDQVDMSKLTELDRCFKEQLPIPEHPTDSFMAFILCKPSLEQRQLTIHAFQRLDPKGLPSGELWVKFKSCEGIHATFGGTFKPAELPLKELQQCLLGDRALPELQEKRLDQGPNWLHSPIECNASNTEWRLPALVTPMDVPERFAGLCYLKLVTLDHPAAATLKVHTEEIN